MKSFFLPVAGVPKTAKRAMSDEEKEVIQQQKRVGPARPARTLKLARGDADRDWGY